MRPVSGVPLIHVENRSTRAPKRFENRLFDIVFASDMLLCGLPLLVAVAVVIKLTSKGSVFYNSERIGIDGRPFERMKFRTIVDGAHKMVDNLAAQNESEGGVLFKIMSDPRFMPAGRIMRKYSIDELPQLIDVFTRDMSVVGPHGAGQRGQDS